MTIIELREKRNKAWEAAKAFVETKRDKDGLLSAEDAASYAEMEQKIKDYGAEIERMEQMAAMDAQLSNLLFQKEYVVDPISKKSNTFAPTPLLLLRKSRRIHHGKNSKKAD